MPNPISAAARHAVMALALAGACLPPAAASNPSPVEMQARAGLPQPGWISTYGMPSEYVATSDRPGQPASAGWMTAGTPWMAQATARAEVPAMNRVNEPVRVGTSAFAQAIATAAGGATASARADWFVAVVINPFAGGNPFGQALYQRLIDRFGCTGPGGCQPVVFDTTFAHLSTGAFRHSVQPHHVGTASYRETVSIGNNVGSTLTRLTFAGEATYAVQPSSSLNQLEGRVTASGGWSAADFTNQGVQPVLADFPGPVESHGLFALRQGTIASDFTVIPVPQLGGLALPATVFALRMEQVASAGFASGYGWGAVQADFDDTAATSVLSLLDPTGEFQFDPSMLHVSITPVPEPAPLALLLAGLAVLMLRTRRRAKPRARPALAATAAPAVLGLALLAALPAQAQGQPPAASSSRVDVSFSGCSGGFALGATDLDLACSPSDGRRATAAVSNLGGLLQTATTARVEGPALASAQATANWGDTLHIGPIGPNVPQPAWAVLRFAIQGRLVVDSVGSPSDAASNDLIFDVALQPFGWAGTPVFERVGLRQDLGSSPREIAFDEALVLPVSLAAMPAAGGALALQMTLLASSFASSNGGGGASADADLGRASGLERLSFLDASGVDITQQVSARWAFGTQTLAPIPEPGSAALALAGGLVLAAWTTRRRQRIARP